MAKAKKTQKPKEPVRIRLKELSNGNRSIYLDIYSKGKRSYEFLKLYLIPEVDDSARTQNANTLKAANFIKSQRIIQLTNDEAGVVSKDSLRSKILLIDWMEEYKRKKAETGQSKSNALTIVSVINHLKTYRGEGVLLADVDENYCRGFIRYLQTAKTEVGKKKITIRTVSRLTASSYFVCFASALNEAVRRKLIPANPTKYLSQDDRRMLRATPPRRGYLSLEELQKLIDTECKFPQIKQAFLFGCFCGLRISDIRALRWSNVEQNDGQWSVSVIMTKTKELLYLPLSDEAVEYLPDRGTAAKDDPVFSMLPDNSTTLNNRLKKWLESAGIDKKVCFHVSRHTFATSLLTLGADLYTTSKLLGHKNIHTTQIYAEIINQKKVDAVNLMGAAFNGKEAGNELG